ncbi:MAG: VCBS repeat-containing protein, partial [Candidatus Promineifilaceae bacterium]
VAIRHDGTVLWQTDIAPGFGMAPGTHEIHSSPAVADIDADGYPEIAVGSGTIQHEVCTQGGVIVLDHNGNVEPGWPKLSHDGYVPPAGCAETIISSPSLGDLDNDGDMEVISGGFDKRIYAWHHDGTLLPGFPPNSYHRERFPTWPTLNGLLADDVWSSPSLADIDGDGFLDIVTGTGEGNFDERYGGDANGWVCPYESPPGDGSPGYCGGAIYALNRFGELLPGFPRYFLESMVSSLAMADVDDDGSYEMFIGFSDYYYTMSPNHPTYGFRLLGLDSYANDLPGWSGGKAMGGVSMMSPAIGDIAGGNGLEVVTMGGDRKLYAWHVDGTPVVGFPMTPLDLWGDSPVNFQSFTGLILADYDGDPKMEILFNQAWALSVVDGNGQQLTNTNYPHGNAPVYYGDGMLVNTPAVGDIDNDGKLELVSTNSVARVWDLDNATNGADWPMFKRDAQRQSRIPRKTYVDAAPEQLILFQGEGNPSLIEGAIRIQNPKGGAFNWSATAPTNISITPSSGMLRVGEAATVQVTVIASGLDEGLHALGNVEFKANMIGEESDPAYDSVPVALYIGTSYRDFVSILFR